MSPLESPWGGLRSLLVPSLVVGPPLGAIALVKLDPRLRAGGRPPG